MMDFCLQFGWGMMDHARSLIAEWGEGIALLSPRDLSGKQVTKLAHDLHAMGGDALLDPQFYLPDADHGRLTSHDFWPSDYATGAFWGGDELIGLIERLAELANDLGSKLLVLPGVFAGEVNDDWIGRQALTIEEAKSATDLPLIATIALSESAIRSDKQIDDILAAAEEWRAHGYYLVCEHPGGEYLVDDPIWLANIMDLVAGLRLKGALVIVGYSNQQMLQVGCAAASAIASGTWMNVRCFPPEKFRASLEDEIKRKATWYYSPTLLSEYKLAFLDLAQRHGVVELIRPPADCGSHHASALFQGIQPSSVGWTETLSFRHYLSCLRQQATDVVRSTFDDTIGEYRRRLDTAEAGLQQLHSRAITGQNRDFLACIDACRGALGLLEMNRGGQLRRKWSELTA